MYEMTNATRYWGEIMSDRMVPLSFRALLDWVFGESQRQNSIFGIRRYYHHESASIEFLDGEIELPCGPAAGPHTQLAPNLIAAYLTGARFFELKTVQTLDGEDLEVAKPCIWAGDEAYNVEWSTELRVEQALQEYIHAHIVLQILARELDLGDPAKFVFNMSVGYTLEGIQSPKIDNFINGLIDASSTAIWRDAMAVLKAHGHLFKVFTIADIEALSPHICSSIALSTMHGAKPSEIEPMLRHLIGNKGLHTYLKMNPTLLGYDKARQLLDDVGYKHLVFERSSFEHDLQFADAKAMIERLLAFAEENDRQFGVKLTNTFPVAITNGTLPGEMMYMSGKPLFVLSLSVAMLIAENFPDIAISYSGGADAFNIQELYQAGISPITICTTLLKNGGYYRQQQISEMWQHGMQPPKLSVAKMAALLKRVTADSHYRVSNHYKVQKAGGVLPQHQCFSQPCQRGCPIEQDVSAYMYYAEREQYDEAMHIVLARNPLPFITGGVCYAFCQNKCVRNHCDDNLSIRDVKLQIAQRSTVRTVDGIVPNGKTALVIGGGAAGMAAAQLLARRGYLVSLHERADKLGGILTKVIKNEPNLQSYIDADRAILENIGVTVVTNSQIDDLTACLTRYDVVYLATGATAFAKLLGIEKTAHAQLIESAKKLNITLIGEAAAQQKTSVVECIASAWRAVGESESGADRPNFSSRDTHDKKGVLEVVQEDDAKRCLHCDSVCENCVDVCPNRANISLPIEGLTQPEILHFDDFCNECGNCTMFCPYDGAPYLEKTTYFSTRESFENSANPGFCLLGDSVLYRQGGVVEQCRVEDLEGVLRSIVEYLINDYSFIIPKEVE